MFPINQLFYPGDNRQSPLHVFPVNRQYTVHSRQPLVTKLKKKKQQQNICNNLITIRGLINKINIEIVFKVYFVVVAVFHNKYLCKCKLKLKQILKYMN